MLTDFMHTYDLCDPLSHELNGQAYSGPDSYAAFDVLLSVHDVHESKGCPVCHFVFQSVLFNSQRCHHLKIESKS